MLVNLRKIRKTSTRRINLKTKVRGKERNSSSATAKGLYEAHFNAASDEATTSGKRSDEAVKPNLMTDDYIDGENMIVEYNSNDVFGDQE
jgi:hypothetical protein